MGAQSFFERAVGSVNSDWKIEKLAGRFSYSKANLGRKATSLTYVDRSPKPEITQGLIGTKSIEGTPTEKYLYSTVPTYVSRKKDNGEKILNIIVETKDMDKESSLRKIEDAKIDCAKEFFNQLTIDGYKAEFKTQLNNKKIRQIIDEVLAE